MAVNMSAGLRLAKKNMRSKIKSILNALNDEEKERQCKIITRMFLATPEYKMSRSIAVYLSMPDEVNTDGILQDVFKSGKKCYIPRYVGSNMDMLRLHSMEDYSSLPKTKWNISQPAESDERENALSIGQLDLILAPGLAFTKDGKRLGRGKGYYDTYLAKVRDAGLSPYTIAIAYACQMLEDIPTSELDYKMDKVIYPDL